MSLWLVTVRPDRDAAGDRCPPREPEPTYVIRTTISPEQMSSAKVVATYKSLSRVERDFRSVKAPDVDLRPIRH